MFESDRTTLPPRWFPQQSQQREASAAGRSVASRERSSRDRADAPSYVPPGWPERVLPPGAPGWESSASTFLLDCCPADYRAYPVLRNHPMVLAQFAAEFVEGQLRVSREGLSRVRAHLEDVVDARVVQSAADAWQNETARLVRVQRAVALVEEALRGRVFIPKL